VEKEKGEDMKIKKGLDVHSGDFWYDLADGGYLDPAKICADKKDAAEVKKAIEVIKDFQTSCEEQIEEFVQ